MNEYVRASHFSINAFCAETPEEICICTSFQNGFISEMEATHQLMALDMDFFEAQEFLATHGAY